MENGDRKHEEIKEVDWEDGKLKYLLPSLISWVQSPYAHEGEKGILEVVFPPYINTVTYAHWGKNIYKNNILK